MIFGLPFSFTLLSAWGAVKRFVIWLFSTWPGRIVLGILTLGATWFLGQRKGRKAEKDAQERRNLEEYREVRENVDDAIRAADGDTRPVRERLRDKGALRD